MTTIRVSLVDVYVVRRAAAGLEFLALRRGSTGRNPGSWEAVHGHIEAGETPAAAARRELSEETGLMPARLYNLSRVESFYQHRIDEVALVPVFVALVEPGAEPRIGSEHDALEWLGADGARTRFSWPRERRAVDDVLITLAPGDAGPLEDVLRVC